MEQKESKRISLLLIEDDLIDQMAFKRAVKEQNLPYDFEIANSVAKAIQILEEKKFDVIVADFHLGDGTSFDILDKNYGIPFIIVTGGGDEEIAVSAMKKGARDYLIKDTERSYLQLLPIIVEQVIQHRNLLKAQSHAEDRIKMLFHAVEQSSTSVVITDALGNIEYVNPKFVKTMGYSIDEVIGKNPRIWKTDYHSEDFYKNLWSTVLSGNTWNGEFLNQKKNGLCFWEMTSISPVFDNQGNIVHIISIKEDVTEQKKVKQALEFRVNMEYLINQISTNFINITTNQIDQAVNESLEKISNFIEIDLATVFMLKNKDETYHLKFYWKTDDINFDNEEIRLLSLEEIPWLHQNLLNSELVLIPDLNALPPGTEKEKKILESLRVKSMIILPMLYENKLMGFLGLSSIKFQKSWDTDTIKLFEIMVEIIVNALQRKRVAEEMENLYHSLKQEFDLATSVQSYLLPQWINYNENILFSSVYKPSSSIGGDLFDILKISDSQFVVYVGDISGHGVKAALMMTAVKSIISMLIESEKNDLKPYKVIMRLNKMLCKHLFQKDYMTISLALIDLEKNEIRYLNAGHPPIIEYDLLEGKATILKSQGSIPVGWYDNFEYLEEDEETIEFKPDKAYLLYTDGIFECENPQGVQLGLDGLTNFLEEFSDLECGMMIPHKFKQSLMDLKYDINSDDFTMVEFQRMPVTIHSKFNKFYVVNSILKNTGPIGKECFDAVVEHLDNKELAIKAEMVFNEFMNNIIEHGMHQRSDTQIAFRFELYDHVKMTFWDTGVDWEAPTKKEDDIAEEGKFRGMGMQIIYSLASSFEKKRFDSINETRIIMR